VQPPSPAFYNAIMLCKLALLSCGAGIGFRITTDSWGSQQEGYYGRQGMPAAAG
jgi:hypothetical protein